MIRTYRAELTRIFRKRTVAGAAAAAVVFAIVAAVVVITAAKSGTGGARAVSVARLAAADGGSHVFRLAASFAGTFLFVVFVGITAAEFSRGTIRTMLLRQPRRTGLLAGRLAAQLTFAAAALALAEVVTWTAARLIAPAQGIPTAAWSSVSALAHAGSDYVAVFVWISGYAILGTALATVIRSVPLALAVGVAWAGPIEHLVQNAWAPAGRWFPGLLLEALAAGGTVEVTATRALLTVALYVAAAAIIATVDFRRRDVTAG